MKKKVGIFMGGYSSEWQISMQSGQTVFDALNPDDWDRYKVSIRPEGWEVMTAEGTFPLKRDTLSFEKNGTEIKFDVVFNAIHGHPGEDGYLQALLELNNIPHSSCAAFESALTFNKSKTNALLNAQGITVPEALFFSEADDFDTKKIVETLGLPLFIKPNRSGSSFGISKVSAEGDMEKAIAFAKKEDVQIVAESAIIGTEMGCGVVRLDGKTQAIAITEIVSKNEFFDYQAKYEGASEEITPARIPEDLYVEICNISGFIYNYLGLWGVVRIDFIVRDNIPYLIEVNSVPGLSPASIVPQQIAFKNWELSSFFGGLLNESMAKSKK